MSDSEENLPSRDECEARCQRFADVTGTDTALAMFYLQDTDWELDRALNAFYESNAGSEKTETGKRPADDNEDGETKAKKTRMEETVDPEPHRIRIISWNIDGLDESSIERRTKAVCDIINKESPQAAFLQEITPLTQAILKSGCPNYRMIVGGDTEYFTCMLLRLGQVEILHHQTLPFPDTVMMRNLLLVQVNVQQQLYTW